MTIAELNEILKQKDTQKILTAFSGAGFKDMTKDNDLNHFSLEDIAKSKDYGKTEYHESLKFGYQATLHGRIINLPNYQIIWLQVDKIDLKKQTVTPKKCYIYYKGV